TPKALLKIKDRYLIDYSIHALAKINIREIVINICYEREQIKIALGDGARYGVHIHYSEEAEALETGGGIAQALPLLGAEPFIALSCDLVTDYPLENLLNHPKKLAHLVLVDNPPFHLRGDFSLNDQEIYEGGSKTLTFASIGIYQPSLFDGRRAERFRLGDLLKQAIAKQQVTGEYYAGYWHNIGTPDQLAELNAARDSLPFALP
ncbi:MAG TPA: sugar phosphate nucleotidyltransferase, partial [Gammaproteobacteria bacterium]|nr:sugar phosphate nucleotidyltransferase [Gammaproteobacteria bacterium]